MMEFMSLVSSKNLRKVFEGDGGSYYSWSSSEFPILGEAKLGGGRLLLNPLGFALPHYADSSKIGYVLQGSGKVGMVLPKTSDNEEKVLRLKKGDIIPVPLGSISWWFNDGDSEELTVIFLGETSKALHPGDFTYFLLAGTQGLFNGFSPNFVAKFLGLKDEEEAKNLVRSQTGVLIVKLKEAIAKECAVGSLFNTETATLNIKVEKGGEVVVVTSGEVPLLEEVGLSAAVVRVCERALYLPEFSLDSAFQMIYVARGSGRVEVVGENGGSVLETSVEEGQLVVVPRFFVVSKLAGEEGMECFTVLTTPQPVISQLVGRASVWTAFGPQVVQAALNITPDQEERLRTNMSKNEIFVPSPN